MEAEIKKQIIQKLIQNDVLVGEDIVNRLDSIQDENIVKKIQENHDIILEENFMERLNTVPDDDSEKEMYDRGNVDVLWSYDEEPKKRTFQDFVSMFRKRYQKLSRMLMQRQDLQDLVSITRLKNREQRDTVAIIGMVQDISITNNGNYIITLEDDTGITKALISKKSENKELLAAARDLVLDEVVGITGVLGDNIIFVNNIVFPDVPLSNELRKAPDEEYAIFMGDLHLGSKYFLYDEFNKMTKWLKGELGNKEQRDITSKIRYLFVTGDLVEGVGIYPGQEDDLYETDIYGQYKLFFEFLKKIPKRIQVIICPGNHDASRIAEPQPPLYKEFAPDLYEQDNVFMVSSPSLVNIGSTEEFSGLNVLLYHGYSFTYYADMVPSIREKGGQQRVDLIMKFLLQKRHLAPSHTSSLYIPDANYDPLVIDKIPDFFVSGHIHRTSCSTYRNISLVNASTWVGMTDYQEKLGLKPQPAKIVLANLQTRAMKVLNFEDKKKETEEDKEKSEEKNEV